MLVALMAATGMGVAQKAQEPETDPVILNRIAEWQDLKFGFMMHWGMYAQWGVVESPDSQALIWTVPRRDGA